MADEYWKKCNECKKPIGFGQVYYYCSVSTCNRPRTGLQFCSISCWEPHVEILRHRDAWYEGARAPSQAEWQKILSGEMQEAPRIEKKAPTPVEAPKPKTIAIVRRAGTDQSTLLQEKPAVSQPPIQKEQPMTQNSNPNSNEIPDDVLVVVSKLKNYIKAKSDMNTSADVIDILSDKLRRMCDQAIQNARKDNRKTVMARDFTG